MACAMLWSAAAGAYSVPAAGSAERRAILAALRPAVEARLGKNVGFKISTIRIDKGWAFVVADPQRKAGKQIDIRKVFPEDWDNMDGLRTEAVLRRRGGRWMLVDHAIGATDVWYCEVGPRALNRGLGC